MVFLVAGCHASKQSAFLLTSRRASSTRQVRQSVDLGQRRQNVSWSTQRIPFVSSGRMKFHTWSQREIADIEDRINLSAASRVMDPILKQSASSLQWMNRRIAVSDDGTLQVLLRLPSLLHPSLDELKEMVKNEVKQEIEKWLSESGKSLETLQVNVEAIATSPVPMMARIVDDREELLKNLGPGLANVSHFVAVYSCKGGVGKSTVAVNLAYELARMGGRIGLLDLDVYGPSLPLLVHPKDPAVRASPLGKGVVYPIEHKGVKLLSLGFVAKQSGVPGSGQDNGASIMRGPMAGKVVAQLLKGTDWGELDILVLDLPPGTGDVQLAVLQDLQLSGAVAVTTPSKLATEDTRKGIDMFTSLGVPTFAVLENMAYFECENGTRHFPFGRGIMESGGSEVVGLKSSEVFQLPISRVANDATDLGEPMCLTRPKEALSELGAFEGLAKKVAEGLLKLQYGYQENQQFVMFDSTDDQFELSSVSLSFNKASSDYFSIRLFSQNGGIQRRISPAGLRSRDPKTGDVLPNSPFSEYVEDIKNESGASLSQIHINKTKRNLPTSVIPIKVTRKGRYGFGVDWSDGATIIYSMKCIALAAGGKVVE